MGREAISWRRARQVLRARPVRRVRRAEQLLLRRLPAAIGELPDDFLDGFSNFLLICETFVLRPARPCLVRVRFEDFERGLNSVEMLAIEAEYVSGETSRLSDHDLDRPTRTRIAWGILQLGSREVDTLMATTESRV